MEKEYIPYIIFGGIRKWDPYHRFTDKEEATQFAKDWAEKASKFLDVRDYGVSNYYFKVKDFGEQGRLG